jgi:hypothetical protein
VPSSPPFMIKIMYVSSASMMISSGVSRMERNPPRKSLPETDRPKTCGALRHRIQKRVLFLRREGGPRPRGRRILSARQGEITAVVGPSAEEKARSHLIPRFTSDGGRDPYRRRGYPRHEV